VRALRCLTAETTSPDAHHGQSRAGGHSQGRLRLRPSHGARDSRSLRRAEQESASRLRLRRRTLARWRHSGIRGTLPIAIEARGKKLKRLIVPEINTREAAVVNGVDVYPVRSLIDVIHFVNTGNGIMPAKVDADTLRGDAQHYAVDFRDVGGQQTAQRALEISCAGGHNILI